MGRHKEGAAVAKTNAMRELERAGVAYDLHVYELEDEHSSHLGERVAAQTGLDPDACFKTLVCCGAPGVHVVCCIPVACELDLKKAARAAGEKSLSMLPMRDLLAVTGYVRGGCSPVGMKRRFPRSSTRRPSSSTASRFLAAAWAPSSCSTPSPWPASRARPSPT